MTGWAVVFEIRPQGGGMSMDCGVLGLRNEVGMLTFQSMKRGKFDQTTKMSLVHWAPNDHFLHLS
jgi:hypothetical protein